MDFNNLGQVFGYGFHETFDMIIFFECFAEWERWKKILNQQAV